MRHAIPIVNMTNLRLLPQPRSRKSIERHPGADVDVEAAPMVAARPSVLLRVKVGLMTCARGRAELIMVMLGLVVVIIRLVVIVVVVAIVVVDISSVRDVAAAATMLLLLLTFSDAASAAVRTAASMAWMPGNAEWAAPAKLGKDEGTMGRMIGILCCFELPCRCDLENVSAVDSAGGAAAVVDSRILSRNCITIQELACRTCAEDGSSLYK